MSSFRLLRFTSSRLVALYIAARLAWEGRGFEFEPWSEGACGIYVADMEGLTWFRRLTQSLPWPDGP